MAQVMTLHFFMTRKFTTRKFQGTLSYFLDVASKEVHGARALAALNLRGCKQNVGAVARRPRTLHGLEDLWAHSCRLNGASRANTVLQAIALSGAVGSKLQSPPQLHFEQKPQ